jgi:hypothetical protein
VGRSAGKPLGKRSHGRSRSALEENIKMDLKATAKTREGWILSRIVKSRFLLLQCSIIRVLVFIM